MSENKSIPHKCRKRDDSSIADILVNGCPPVLEQIAASGGRMLLKSTLQIK